jgi:aryl carrier-like protein
MSKGGFLKEQRTVILEIVDDEENLVNHGLDEIQAVIERLEKLFKKGYEITGGDIQIQIILDNKHNQS